jgi:hypothetical protein
MLLFYMAYTSDAIDRRAEKAGYPSGLAAELRQQRATDAQRAVAARYRERHAARVERHHGA